MRVVGIVADLKQGPLNTDTVPQTYLPIAQVSDAMVADNIWGGLRALKQRFNTVLLASFGGTALVLAALGIAGVLATSVSRRTQELGVRMALGAQRGDLMRMVVRQGMILAGLGVALGLAAAFGLTRLMSTLLFQVRPHDPLTFAAVTVALLAVALVACYLPARRATRVDPIVALRYD